MFDIPGISYLKLAGNVAASEHGCSKGCVIEADPFACLQGLIYIRKVSGSYSICQIIIVGYMRNYIIINGLKGINI